MNTDFSYAPKNNLSDCDKVDDIQYAICDYDRLLIELAVADSDVIKMMDKGFCFDSERNKESLEILDSRIHGKGLFAAEDIDEGRTWIAAFKNYKYACGRVINHSPNPNCKFVFNGDLVTCVATKKIKTGSELLVNYRDNVKTDAIVAYKEQEATIEFDSKVPSLSDWEKASPIDKFEYELSTLPASELPLTHIFTDGLYVRKIFVPAGSMFTTVHHNTEHPFILVSGITEVVSNEESSSITGPFMGITQKGTRRLVYAVTDAVYLTIHANPDNLTDPDEIIKRITIPVINPLIDKDDPRFNTWKKSISPSQMILTNNIEK